MTTITILQHRLRNLELLSPNGMNANQADIEVKPNVINNNIDILPVETFDLNIQALDPVLAAHQHTPYILGTLDTMMRDALLTREVFILHTNFSLTLRNAANFRHQRWSISKALNKRLEDFINGVEQATQNTREGILNTLDFIFTDNWIGILMQSFHDFLVFLGGQFVNNFILIMDYDSTLSYLILASCYVGFLNRIIGLNMFRGASQDWLIRAIKFTLERARVSILSIPVLKISSITRYLDKIIYIEQEGERKATTLRGRIQEGRSFLWKRRRIIGSTAAFVTLAYFKKEINYYSESLKTEIDKIILMIRRYQFCKDLEKYLNDFFKKYLKDPKEILDGVHVPIEDALERDRLHAIRNNNQS